MYEVLYLRDLLSTVQQSVSQAVSKMLPCRLV